MSDLSDTINGERTFLHDVSNQLVIAQGMGSFVLKHLKEKYNIPRLIPNHNYLQLPFHFIYDSGYFFF